MSLSRTPQIPLEVLRTLVVVGDVRTFSKAASRLGISQPAVSAQMKRLQEIVGGEIFERDVGGIMPTELGRSVIALARKIIEAHDQILRLRASDLGPDRVRLGISPLLIARFVHSQKSAAALLNVFVQADSSFNLGRSLLDGRLDIACCFAMDRFAPELDPFRVAQCEDEMVWVRSANFVASPGHPLPIVTWHGDEVMTQALTNSGLSYQIVFEGEDYESKRSVVEAGLGLMALPGRLVPPSLMRAKEYYLPALPSIKSAIYIRGKQDSPKLQTIKQQLIELFFPDAI